MRLLSVARSIRRRCFASFLAGDAWFTEKLRCEECFVSQQFGKAQLLPRKTCPWEQHAGEPASHPRWPTLLSISPTPYPVPPVPQKITMGPSPRLTTLPVHYGQHLKGLGTVRPMRLLTYRRCMASAIASKHICLYEISYKYHCIDI